MASRTTATFGMSGKLGFLETSVSSLFGIHHHHHSVINFCIFVRIEKNDPHSVTVENDHKHEVAKQQAKPMNFDTVQFVLLKEVDREHDRINYRTDEGGINYSQGVI